MKKLILIILFISTNSFYAYGFAQEVIKEKTITCEYIKQKSCGLGLPNCLKIKKFSHHFTQIDFKNKIYKTATTKYKITDVKVNYSNIGKLLPISIRINFGIGNYTEIYVQDDWVLPGENPLSEKNVNTIYNKKGFFKEIEVDNGFDIIRMRWGLCRF